MNKLSVTHFKFSLAFIIALSFHITETVANTKGMFYTNEKSLPELLSMLDDPSEVAAAKNYEADFHQMCGLYLLSNRFHDFFVCLDELERTRFRYVHSSDRLYGFTSGPALWRDPSIQSVYWQFAKPRTKRLRLEALFRLNDFTQAYQIGAKALEEYILLSGGIDNLRRNPINGAPTSPWSTDIIVTAGLTALSAAQLGNKKEARRILAILKELNSDMTWGDSLIGPEETRMAYEQQIHLLLKDIDQLKEVDIEGRELKAALSSTGLFVLSAASVFGGGGSGGSFAQTAMELYSHGEIEGAPLVRIELQNARIAAVKKQYNLALQRYNKIISDPALASLSELHWIALFERGSIYSQLGNLENASADLEDAIDLIEGTRGNLSTESMKIGFTGSKTQVYQTLVDVLIKQKKINKAFSIAERSRARTMIDMLADEQLQRNESGLLNDVMSNTTIASNKRLTDTTTEGPQAGNSVRALKRRAKKISVKQPQMSSMVAVDSKAFSQLSSLLKNNETLVEYFKGTKQWYAFIVDSKKVDVIPLGEISINDKAKAFRAAIQETNSNRYKQTSKALYDVIWKPLENKINTSDVVLVLDGSLHYVPFGALHSGEQFLIEHYSIRQLPSLAVSQYLKRSKKRKKPMMVLGNPSLDLPGAESEAISIAGSYKGSTLLLREQATRQQLIENGSSYQRLHIASHGVFNSANPLQSYLLLAGSDDHQAQFTVSDLYQLKLGNDLVVLSGCETGISEIANGNDLLGFNRGFLFAGAQSIVSSLWLVDDQATEQLMTSFYHQLNKQSKNSALREAKLHVMNNVNYHPYYWAAFQLTGAK